eukprot:TRINITY_DN2784_c0_g5_i1.p1 TRINITY_DN2784_c0_g5~~TRINITY_DN2784_c0_g5_i1.p1  ORF type:complete len:278 (-),score=130.07 TRINITY_DN2784_c0_g5_i1:42-875(-)
MNKFQVIIVLICCFLIDLVQLRGTCAFGTTTFTCSDSLATVTQKKASCIIAKDLVVCIGYVQIGLNKNPILAAWRNNVRVWCREDLEITADDSTGIAIAFDSNSNNFYAFFTSTGTQGTVQQDFRRFATNGWLKTYGNGGGAKILIATNINLSTGYPITATFISALLSSGKSNSIGNLTAIGYNSNHNLLIGLSAAYSPRNINSNTFKNCTCPTCPDTTYYNSAKKWNWELTLSSNLSTAIYSCAPACDLATSSQCRPSTMIIQSCGSNNWNWNNRT